MQKPWQSLATLDPEIHRLIEAELHRQQEGLELIASENFASAAVVTAMGNVLTNKYAEGLPAKRAYAWADVLELPRDAFFRFVTGEADRVDVPKAAAKAEGGPSPAELDEQQPAEQHQGVRHRVLETMVHYVVAHFVRHHRADFRRRGAIQQIVVK